MPFMAMQAGRWISNPLPNEQNADAQGIVLTIPLHTQKRISADFANVGVRLDAPWSVQPYKWKIFSAIRTGCHMVNRHIHSDFYQGE